MHHSNDVYRSGTVAKPRGPEYFCHRKNDRGKGNRGGITNSGQRTGERGSPVRVIKLLTFTGLIRPLPDDGSGGPAALSRPSFPGPLPAGMLACVVVWRLKGALSCKLGPGKL